MFCWKPSGKVQSANSAGISVLAGLAASSSSVSMYSRAVVSASRACRRAVARDDVLGVERVSRSRIASQFSGGSPSREVQM